MKTKRVRHVIEMISLREPRDNRGSHNPNMRFLTRFLVATLFGYAVLVCQSELVLADGVEDPTDNGEIVEGFLLPNADEDGDLLTNADEAIFGTDPFLPDTDTDGILDGVEVNVSLTDPLLFDTDGGGTGDGQEFFMNCTDALLPADDGLMLCGDSDGDGVTDANEIANGTDPYTPDIPEPEPEPELPDGPVPVEEPTPADPMQDPAPEPEPIPGEKSVLVPS